MSKKTNGSVEAVENEGANRTLKFHAFATTALATRRSYKIEGHPGVLVIERSLFADGDGPEELTLSVDLVSPKAKVGNEEKEAAKLAKAQERAIKAQERVSAAEARAKERAEKLQAQLEKAKAEASASA